MVELILYIVGALSLIALSINLLRHLYVTPWGYGREYKFVVRRWMIILIWLLGVVLAPVLFALVVAFLVVVGVCSAVDGSLKLKYDNKLIKWLKKDV